MSVLAPLNARWRHANRQGDLTAAALALAPAVLLFALFNIYPLLYSGFLSVMEWNGFSPDRTYVGLDNYRGILESSQFRNALVVTLKYTAGVTVLSVALGLVIAVLLNADIRGRNIYRLIYFLPVVTSTVAAAVVWRYLMTPGTGYADVFLRNLGLTPPSPAWLRNTTWALRIVILVGLWKRLGFNIVVFLAGLQNIPKDFYEAATVDGAGTVMWRKRCAVPAPSTVAAS